MPGQRIDFFSRLDSLSQSVGTEKPNPATVEIDLATPLEIITLLQAQDQTVAEAVALARPNIAVVSQRAAAAFRQGGRLIYVGAGTSGRLGVLDASECPPTFGVSAETVQGVIAGGEAALRQSVEGAEDSAEAGRSAIKDKQITNRDVVVGISANGGAPFVVEALKAARAAGAFTAAITCNNTTALEDVADVAIVAIVGPEPITGSSRMKAGTAQKMILNQISTAAMVLTGKTYGNVMVDVQIKNKKLHQRAVNIICALLDCSPDDAETALQKAQNNVKTAIVMRCQNLSLDAAQALLDQHDGRLRDVIG